MLNKSKGPAVRGPRSQADRKLYRQAMQAILSNQPNLTIIGAAVEDIRIDGGQVRGVVTGNGDIYAAPKVILTTGTFLRGLIHIGEEKKIGRASCRERVCQYV